MNSRYLVGVVVGALGVLLVGQPAQASGRATTSVAAAGGVEAFAGSADCGAGWICLFEDANYGGRVLRWSSPGTRIDHLRDYDFNDKLSSWVNNTDLDAMWYGDSSMGGQSHCIPSRSMSAHVNPGDSASSLSVFTDDRACN
jgi:hypothetical protein